MPEIMYISTVQPLGSLNNGLTTRGRTSVATPASKAKTMRVQVCPMLDEITDWTDYLALVG